MSTPPPTGRREHRGGRDVLVLERTFRAGIDDVWAACTDPERMRRWIGTWSGDPASGRVDFRMTAEDPDCEAEPYDVEACEPPHRLAVRSSEPQPFSEDGPGRVAWVLTLELAQRHDVTTLVFTQEVADPAVAESVGPGWEYYLDRLAAAVGGQPVEDVGWDDYWPAQAVGYRALWS